MTPVIVPGVHRRCPDCQTWTEDDRFVHGVCDWCVETKYRPRGLWCDEHGPTMGSCLGCAPEKSKLKKSKKRRRYERCTGSGSRSSGWPGDEDTCPVCEAWVVVRQDGRFRAHPTKTRRKKR